MPSYSDSLLLKNTFLALTYQLPDLPSTLHDCGYDEVFVEKVFTNSLLQPVKYDLAVCAPERNRSALLEFKGGHYANEEERQRVSHQIVRYLAVTGEDVVQKAGFSVVVGLDPLLHRQASSPRSRHTCGRSCILRPRGTLQQAGITPVLQLLQVGPVGRGDDAGQRHAFARGQQMALGPPCAPIRGGAARACGCSGPPFLPSGALIKQPSADCPGHSRPTSSADSSKRRVQARANAPVRTHSWKRAGTGPHTRAAPPPPGTGPQDPDDALEEGAVVVTGAARLLAEVVHHQERSQVAPSSVLHAPDRGIIGRRGGRSDRISP